MTIALSTLITGMSEFIGAVAVVSKATGGDATKIVDTKLSIYKHAYFDEWWAYVTSGLASGDVRQIEGFTKATTTLDPYTDFTGAIANGDDYELNKFNKADLILALNDAIISIYPKLHRKFVFESLGLSLLTSNANSGQKNVIVADATLFFVGQEVAVKDDNASEDATIASINTATKTLTMEANLANAYTVAANGKVVAKPGKYFNLGATIGQARVPSVFVRADSTSKRNQFMEYEIITNLVGDRQIYFPSAKSVDDQVWIIEAMGSLEEVSNPTDTITLEDRRVKLLYAQAAYHFFLRETNLVSAGDIRRLVQLASNYLTQVNTMYRNLWMPLPRERAYLGDD